MVCVMCAWKRSQLIIGIVPEKQTIEGLISGNINHILSIFDPHRSIAVFRN